MALIGACVGSTRGVGMPGLARGCGVEAPPRRRFLCLHYSTHPTPTRRVARAPRPPPRLADLEVGWASIMDYISKLETLLDNGFSNAERA